MVFLAIIGVVAIVVFIFNKTNAKNRGQTMVFGNCDDTKPWSTPDSLPIA